MPINILLDSDSRSMISFAEVKAPTFLLKTPANTWCYCTRALFIRYESDYNHYWFISICMKFHFALCRIESKAAEKKSIFHKWKISYFSEMSMQSSNLFSKLTACVSNYIINLITYMFMEIFLVKKK